MPAYDYRCKTCDQTATVFAPVAEERPTPICAKCKAEMTRVFSVGGIQLKGQGFYRNDK